MLFSVNKTYEVFTHESVALGDAEDRGFEFQDNLMTVRELVEYIQNNGFVEASCSNWQAQTGGYKTWLNTVDPEINYKTGANTYYGLHIDTTPRNITRIFKLAGIK